MAWIEPLELKTWMINVFAGDGTYFGIIALFCITSLAGYFRMNGLSMFLMIGIFLLMFSGYVPPSLVVFLSIIGGLILGYWVSKIVKG